MPLQNYTGNLITATQWLLSKQNHDGSWGETTTDKVRWTANALYSLNLLGLDPQSKNLRKAATWLMKIPATHPEWYLRIQPLTAVGLHDWLKTEKDLDRVRSIFETDTIGPLSIKVALAYELLREGLDVPMLDLIEKSVVATLRNEESGLCSFAGSTNDTTLYCAFLNKVDRAKYQDIVRRCVRWVILRQIEKPEFNAICWEESYGKTAYVILNLLDIENDISNLDSLLSKTFAFFRPKQNGAIPEDLIPAHNSQSSIYTTILFIRAYAAAMQKQPNLYRKAFGQLIIETKPYAYWLQVAGIWGFSLVSFVATGGLMYFVLGKDFVLSVVASVVAAMVPTLFLLTRKLYAYLVGNE